MTGIILNGNPQSLPDGTSVASLIDLLGLTGKRIAIEHNQEIVPRSRFADTLLAEGDRIEIVHAIGGG